MNTEKIANLYQDHDLQECYDLGFDAGENGANDRNCDFRIFSNPEKTKAWEHGNREGLKLRS